MREEMAVSPLDLALYVAIVPALVAAITLTVAGWAGRRAGIAGSGPAAVALALALGAASQSYAAEVLVLEKKIALGEVRGRIDHLAIDLERQRLFIAELGNDSVGVIDLKAGKLDRRLTGFSEPQGIAYVPAADAQRKKKNKNKKEEKQRTGEGRKRK